VDRGVRRDREPRDPDVRDDARAGCKVTVILDGRANKYAVTVTPR
jgi:hypothetical protein